MNWPILEASLREVHGAYKEAVKIGDEQRIAFWRSVLIERLVLIHGALKDYYGTSGADRDEPEGS